MKYALIIGNDSYGDPKLARLKTPAADSRALANMLSDKNIGGFDDVTLLINQTETEIRRTISGFLASKKLDDLVLIYFSGHGVLDSSGRLFLASKDTQTDILRATAIPSAYIADEMDNCRSKRQILILDCCHSGAFARGTKAGERKAVTATTFEGNGYGRVVLTASDSTQFALEGNQILKQTGLSLFTHFLLEGLQTGNADLNNDGYVSLDEWYDYTYTQVLSKTPKQVPHKWSYRQQGDLVIAKNPHYELIQREAAEKATREEAERVRKEKERRERETLELEKVIREKVERENAERLAQEKTQRDEIEKKRREEEAWIKREKEALARKLTEEKAREEAREQAHKVDLENTRRKALEDAVKTAKENVQSEAELQVQKEIEEKQSQDELARNQPTNNRVTNLFPRSYFSIVALLIIGLVLGIGLREMEQRGVQALANTMTPTISATVPATRTSTSTPFNTLTPTKEVSTLTVTNTEVLTEFPTITLTPIESPTATSTRLPLSLRTESNGLQSDGLHYGFEFTFYIQNVPNECASECAVRWRVWEGDWIQGKPTDGPDPSSFTRLRYDSGWKNANQINLTLKYSLPNVTPGKPYLVGFQLCVDAAKNICKTASNIFYH